MYQLNDSILTKFDDLFMLFCHKQWRCAELLYTLQSDRLNVFLQSVTYFCALKKTGKLCFSDSFLRRYWIVIDWGEEYTRSRLGPVTRKEPKFSILKTCDWRRHTNNKELRSSNLKPRSRATQNMAIYISTGDWTAQLFRVC